ncbi:hypothetical protein BXZ70DRAFT_289500 [Cristinia sonorae]|uniref:Myb-like domain-containing protein n=1 Tax=Cristinia sonorae TaxID=1940300 RepID=A0A8K0UMB4_9AGAR|nr:hypothetical protein BXZ70DRAFT_289500 [Cristinia sonorae]
MPPPPTVPSRPEVSQVKPPQIRAAPESVPEASMIRGLKPPAIQPTQSARASQSQPPTVASVLNRPHPPIPAPPQQPLSPPQEATVNVTDTISAASLRDVSTVPLPAPSIGPSERHTSPGGFSAPNVITIDNSQIDPALLEAVVTALQHAEQDVRTAPAPQSLPAKVEPAAQQQNASQLQQSVIPVEKIPPTRRKRTTRSAVVVDDIPTEIDTENSATPSTSTSKAKKPRKRKRTDSSGANQTGDEEDEESTSSGRKRQSRGGRKSKVPPIPSFDPEADPGEELDPTSVTMGNLCDDPGTGRVSSKAADIVSNHAAWRAANKEKRARLKAIMEAKKYGRNLEEEEENVTQTPKESSTPSPEDPTITSATNGAGSPLAGPSSLTHNTSDNEQGEGRFDYSQAMSTSRYNVQVRIGPNGETIIDEDSLFVDTNQEDDTATYTHVEESDATKFVNSASYSKKSRGSRWSAEETELFYDALSQFGENYELISFMLPGRDRKACKNKFKAEDKRDPARITYCLTHKRPYDIDTLSRMTGKDFSGPTPVIRTPTPISTVEDAQPPSVTDNTTINAPKPTLKKKKPRDTADVEVLGNVSDLEDDVMDLALEQGLRF